MPLTKILFKPGIDKEGTAYTNEGGWFDVNLVRFRKGFAEKFKGWERLSDNTYLGNARALHPWTALEGTKYLGLGSQLKYYINEGNSFNDITPIRSTTAAGDVTFAAVNGDATITVSDTAHGAVQNDFVTFSGAVSLGGNITAPVLNQEYQIATIIDANSYTIEAKDTDGNTVLADGSDTGNGGASVVGAYQINVGLDVYVPSTGWGIGTWGAGGFGSVTSLTTTNQLRTWSHDNFGENLIINVRAGGIYQWTENDGVDTRAVELSQISGANLVPTVANQVITSEKDRHLIVLGVDPISGGARTGVIDPMLVAFSDQENALEFEPLSTNTAGSLRLSSGSQIIGAVKSRQEIVIFTDTSVYSMQFIGPPFTFGINLINQSTGLIAPKAAITTPVGIFFMSFNDFYVYNGAVRQVPCTVLDYVFSDINLGQAFKIFAFSNNAESEVGWFYPSASSDEIDRYVIYNYENSTWTFGQLLRYAWIDADVENFPRATANNLLYRQEIGFNNDGQPMENVFIESADFDIGDGEQLQYIKRIIPDIKFLNNATDGEIEMVLKMRNFPGDTLSTKATVAVGSTTQQNFVRGRGRQAVVRFQSKDSNGNSENDNTGWRIGATRIDIKPDGRR